MAASADMRLAFSFWTATGSMPARRTSRPSCRRKLRASITAATRPSPCGSNTHPAASAGRAASSTSIKLHGNATATNPPRRGFALVAGSMTLRPVGFLYADHLPTSSISDIVSLTKGMSMEVNGIAHIFLTASNFESSLEFYRKLLRFLGPKPDELHGFLCSLGVTIMNAPREDAWAARYYAQAFED